MKGVQALFRHLRRTERGQNLVEFALVLPMVILLVMGTIDIGLGFRTYIALTNAAREGARWVSIYPSDCSTALARVESEAAQIGISKSVSFGDGGYTATIAGSCPFAAGDKPTVSVNYSYELLFGIIPGMSSIPLTTSATMVVLYSE